MTCDLEYFLDHCKELGTSQDGSNCASNDANIDTSLTSNGDENICPTIDSLSFCQLERTTPDAENTSSKPELEKTFVIYGDGKGPLGDYQLDVMNPHPENTSSEPNFQETVLISGIGKDSLDGCQLESNQPGPKSPSSKPDFQETIGVSELGKKNIDGCQLESNKPNTKSTSSKPVHGNSSPVEGQKFFTSDDEQVERSSFGFLESCFELRNCFVKLMDVTVVPGENGESFKCKFCTKSFLRARYLRRHILTHTEVKPYRCKTCESCFSRYDHLKLHQARCRGKRQLEVRVEKMICLKRLSTPSDLKRHMAMLHITDKPFPCKRCGKTYSSKKTLSRHNLTIRCKKISKESVPSAKNDVQTQPCRETSKLLQRIQVHYMNKFKYQCEYCPRRFKLSGQLKVHVHQENDPEKGDVSIHKYQCSECDQSFTDGLRLISHLEEHGREDQERRSDIHRCHVCNKVFAQAGILQRHVKMQH
uniref:C2H2-type domain-containing protein n=1 Tax=Cyprinus carpio TaxID=7962 RepID=A0A8C2EE25_CYPCA